MEPGFEADFTDLQLASGRWRHAGPDELLDKWARFVEECIKGYAHDAEDYFNDLTARGSLKLALSSPLVRKWPVEMARLKERVEALDERLRPIFRDDAFPRFPAEEWWLRGIVRYGGLRFVETLRDEYGIEIEVRPPDDRAREP